MKSYTDFNKIYYTDKDGNEFDVVSMSKVEDVMESIADDINEILVLLETEKISTAMDKLEILNERIY